MNKSFLAAATATVTLLIHATAQADGPRLASPVECTPGETCWVVNYFDHDPGAGMRDYHCGALGYDGHDGTDIAIRDGAAMAAGVPVVAAAPGTVKGMRDGMPDTGLKAGRESVKGRECGNGVVIAHDGGWETQYCHMRRGSVAVRSGERVERGQRLGLVGLSGHTEFPHLHLTVRHDGKKIDPFLGDTPPSSCGIGANALWDADAAAALAYRPVAIYNVGFSGGPPDPDRIRSGDHKPEAAADAPALVLWADIFGVDAGDRISLRIIGPDGATVAENTRTLDRRQIRRFEYAGKRTPGEWPAGTYTGEIVVTRKTDSGETAVRERTQVELRQ